VIACREGCCHRPMGMPRPHRRTAPISARRPSGREREQTFSLANAGTAPLHLRGRRRVALSGAQAATSPSPLSLFPQCHRGSTTIRHPVHPVSKRGCGRPLTIENDSDINRLASPSRAPARLLRCRFTGITSDLAAGSITCAGRWRAQFQVEKAATVHGTVSYRWERRSPSGCSRDADALKTGTRGFYPGRQL